MICRVLVAKDSDSSERVTSASRGWTHISLQWWDGVIVGLSGCFLLFFQGSPCSSPFADTWALKERDVWRGRPKRPGLEKGESKLAEGWEKPSGRTRQAWDSGRLKRMGKKERNKPGKMQAESCCSGKALLVGKRPPNSWYYHSSAISYGLQNTLDRHLLSRSMSSWRTQQPAFYRPSHQWSGWESKRSHLIWPMWTEGALGCFLPFLSASFLFGWEIWMHKTTWKNIYSGRKVKHFSPRKCCKHSCWATIGLNLN